MAVKRRKDGKKMPDPWTCPKCGQTFQQKGRHAKACTGKPKVAKAPRVRSAPERAVVAKASTNGHSDAESVILTTYNKAFTELVIAHEKLMSMVKDLHGEVQLYHRENQELRAFKQRASALFEPDPKVPRA